jgi:hypothetical protein
VCVCVCVCVCARARARVRAHAQPFANVHTQPFSCWHRYSNSCHPGNVNTKFLSNALQSNHWLVDYVDTVEQKLQPALYVTTSLHVLLAVLMRSVTIRMHALRLHSGVNRLAASIQHERRVNVIVQRVALFHTISRTRHRLAPRSFVSLSVLFLITTPQTHTP